MSEAANPPTDACTRAKLALGGPVALSRALGERGVAISSQAISKWDKVPAERVLLVEALTGVSRYDLRPDVFGPTPEAVQ